MIPFQNVNISIKSLTKIDTDWYRFVNELCITCRVHKQKRYQNEYEVANDMENGIIVFPLSIVVF